MFCFAKQYGNTWNNVKKGVSVGSKTINTIFPLINARRAYPVYPAYPPKIINYRDNKKFSNGNSLNSVKDVFSNKNPNEENGEYMFKNPQ